MFNLRMRLLTISMSLATPAAFASMPFIAPVVQAAPANVVEQSLFSPDVPCFPDLPALPSLPCFSDCVTPVATETPTSNLTPRVQSTPTPMPTATPTPRPTATPTPMPTATPTPRPTATPTPRPTATPTPKPTPQCECSTPTPAENSTNYDNGNIFNQMQDISDGYGN